ncbi:MAG: 16S rRNA (uracil(1498)-N(3))-methyltransferase [Microbacteriaceae bacterium]|nr:16S rRNA (uracil(1498)-N(3))-methyltransferase [Microbacteriaceae bacterium]
MALHFIVDELPALLDEHGEILPNAVVVLAGAEARHAVTVRRVRAGEAVTVGDGRGTLADGVCERAEAAEVIVRVTAVRRVEAGSPRLVLVQALAKGDRDELAIQAATELGVDAVLPWAASRSVSRWDGPKVAKGLARWATIVREASKQAHRARVPEVGPLVTTGDLVALAATSRMLLLEPTAAARLSELRLAGAGAGASTVADERDLVLVVGPEGGFSPEELERLAAAGATPARMGETVLRTSTAGPAALAVVSVLLGRW